MATQVIKKDGSKVPFEPEKIRKAVLMAAAEANISEDKKQEIAGKVMGAVIQMVEGKEEVTSTDIRTKALMELDNIEPTVSDAWRKYDREKKGVQS
jgi:transcriptional regulator NrdR family protein